MNIGTIGSGQIVHEILKGVQMTEGVSCGAVYSRKQETGAALAARFGVEKVYTDMEALLSDRDLDTIYIASPNSLHAEHAVYYPNRHENGVDVSGILVMRYPNFICTCEGAKDTWGVNSAQIQGEEGFLCVKDGCNWFSEVTLETRGFRKQINDQEPEAHWWYEVRELAKIIHERNRPEYERRKALTLDVAGILEQARK